MEMIYIHAGEFLMGCDPDQKWGIDCLENELPLHLVYLDAFLIDKFEVSNHQYAQCVSDGFCKDPSDFSSSTRDSYYDNPAYANFPVIYVDWYDARDYCAWAGQRLPSEAEWEKAALFDADTRFPRGNRFPDCNKANYKNCIGDTNEVGSYPVREHLFVVMDMSGNVSEWVNDWYNGNYYEWSPYKNPLGPDSGSYKVTRGGSWGDDYVNIRLMYRDGLNLPKTRLNDIGFRCAMTP